jgi:hypothetical protein
MLWVSGPSAVGLCALILPFLGRSPSTRNPPTFAESTRARFPLVVTPDPVSIGVVKAGEPAQAKITLRNPDYWTLTLTLPV